MTRFERFLDRLGAYLRVTRDVGARLHHTYKRGFK